MGSEPCDELQAELALDLIEAELAVELPAHMRAFARAHATDRPPPPAPLLARSASTLSAARNACAHDLLVDRGLALLRLVAPLAIESDPAVTAARAEPPTWPGLQRLTEARDRVAQATFGCSAIALVHRLNGVSSATPPTLQGIPRLMPGPPIEGWRVPDAPLDPAAILDAWHLIAERLGVAGSVRIERTATSRPRAFVIEPKQEVIVVIPAVVDTPAARFAILHELGHAVVALGVRSGVPRAVDEAAASYVARLAEPPSWLPATWPSELAASARARRLAIATSLDGVERRLPALDAVALTSSDPDRDARGPADLTTRYGPTPPWALWHDPGAQASYVAAEALADRLRLELGVSPARGQLLRALIAERDRIDQHTRL